MEGTDPLYSNYTFQSLSFIFLIQTLDR